MCDRRFHERLFGTPLVRKVPGGAVTVGPRELGQDTGLYQVPLSLGSSTSRRASPSRFHANTTMAMARPGNTPSHGASCTYVWAAPFNIPPQDGTSGGTPIPRKLRVASSTIAGPTKVCTCR